MDVRCEQLGSRGIHESQGPEDCQQPTPKQAMDRAAPNLIKCATLLVIIKRFSPFPPSPPLLSTPRCS